MRGDFFRTHRLSIAATTLVGTIVGAGILGIPYVIAQTGLVPGGLLIIFLGLIFMLLNLQFGEIILRTKKQHQLPGYAQKYLGPWGKKFMVFGMATLAYGALTAYLIGEGATLKALFGGSSLFYLLAFFIITFIIIYRGIRSLGTSELVLIGLLIFVLILISFFSLEHISLANLTTQHWTNLLIPYGVILFAYAGLPSLPELQEELGRKKQLFKKAIIIGSAIPIVLYLLFAIVVVGSVGVEQFAALQPNERIATIALGLTTNPLLGILANILAFLAMFTSYLTIGTALVEMYQHDYNVPKWLSFLLALVPPLVVAVFEITTFISALAISGAISGGIEALMVLLMHNKAKLQGDRKPEYTLASLPKIIMGLLMLIFVAGIVHQLYTLFF